MSNFDKYSFTFKMLDTMRKEFNKQFKGLLAIAKEDNQENFDFALNASISKLKTMLHLLESIQQQNSKSE